LPVISSYEKIQFGGGGLKEKWREGNKKKTIADVTQDRALGETTCSFFNPPPSPVVLPYDRAEGGTQNRTDIRHFNAR
jgi:hypothetical protein